MPALNASAYRIHRIPAASRYRVRGIARGSAVLLAALLLAGAGAATDARDTPDAERAAVLAVVDALFDGMRTRDAGLLRAQFAGEARLGTLGIEDFIARVTAGEAYLDEVTFDETVLVDDDLAMAWTPYNLFVDGAFHHCGVDLFTMRRVEGRWQITHLADTRRTERCDPARR